MELALVPLLRLERDLYDLPRDRRRFQRYLELLTAGTDDVVRPLARLNPMGREQVAAALDALLALDAEAHVAVAIAAARPRLAGVAGALKVGLVVADDVGGGWTQRELTEAQHRFDNLDEPRRGWAVVLCWASEPPTREALWQETLAAIFRACLLRQRGRPRTLAQMLEQEGLAARFAGAALPSLPALELARIRAAVAHHRATTSFPTQFACLYGDAAARAVGYPALGLPARAGFALALHDASQRPSPPEAALLR